jgi:hypothetical protein
VDYRSSSSDYGVAGTGANASILGSARRWRVAFGRWPNVHVEVSSNLVGGRFHVNLRFALMNDEVSKANSERVRHDYRSDTAESMRQRL